MERYLRVGYIKTSIMFLLFSLSIFLFTNGTASAASQYVMTCSSCHGMPPADLPVGALPGDRDVATGAFKGSHETHAGSKPTSCTMCHNSGNRTTSHRDGKIQFAFTINSSTSGTYSKGYPARFTNQTSIPVMGNCSNVNCHFNTTTPTWGSDKAATNCDTCHVSPPSDGSHPTIAAGSGKKHGDYYGTDLNSCAKCHPNHNSAPAPFSHATSAGRSLVVSFTTAPNTGGSYTGDVSYPTYLSNPSRTGTCVSTYCHSNGKNGAPNVPAVWGSTLDCAGCHGAAAGTAFPLTTGKHAAHVNATTNPAIGTGLACKECHAKTVSNNTTVSNLGLHVNKFVDYSGVKAGKSSTYASSTGVCSATYCHSDGKGTQKSMTADGWNGATTLDCKGCHGSAASPEFASLAGEPNYSNLGSGVPRANSHKKHVSTVGASTCTYCHGTTTTNGTVIASGSTSHVDGEITVVAGGGKSFGWSAKTCSNISCHSTGGSTPSATWGATLDCKGCHGSDQASGTIITSGRHTSHLNTSSNVSLGTALGCVECHGKTVSNNTTVSNAGLHANGFIDYSGARAGKSSTYSTSTGVCSATYCHSDGKGSIKSMTADNWKAATTLDCKGCHGSDAAPFFTSVAGEPNYSNTGSGAPRANTHQKHVTTVGASTCVYCHSSTTTTGTAILAGSTAHVNGTVTVLAGNGKTFNWTAKTCSNISCHAAPATTAFPATWGATLDCKGCHGGDKASGTAITTGKHTAHIDTATNTSLGTALGCVECHSKTVSNNTTISTATNHVTGFVDYSGVRAGKSSTYSTSTGVCSATYCHSDGKGTAKSMTADNWKAATTLDCKGCHGSDAAFAFVSVAGEPNYSNLGAGVPKANSHKKHVGASGAATCVNCHSATTSTGTSIISGATTHVDGSISVVAGNGKTFTWAGSKTCNSISCHNSYNAQWGATLNCSNCHVLSGTHLVHSGKINLNGGVSFYNYTANVSGSGQYGFGCANCHPSTDSGTHTNGSVQTVLNGDAAGAGSLRTKNLASAIYNSGSKTCDNIYCHSDGISTPGLGTAVWGVAFTGDKCAKCHGNSPSTGAHSSHVVAIHYKDIFNGVSGKLSPGSTGNVSHGMSSQVTTLNCDICHNSTVATVPTSRNARNTVCITCHSGGVEAAIADVAMHVNGKTDVKFASVNIYTKAQLRPVSFRNYTAGTAGWSRNKVSTVEQYKTGAVAFDVSKYPLNSTATWVAGVPGQGTCGNVVCHNMKPAETVKWNDALTCESCHIHN